MKHRIILEQAPGKIVYAGAREGYSYHNFTDTAMCPVTQNTADLPGKGALGNRISSFLFAKLNLAGVPTHFVKSCNMRESLVRQCGPLPFSAIMHARAHPHMAMLFDTQPMAVFDPALIEYRTPCSAYHINDDFLLALDWLDQDELDECRALIERAGNILQGIFAAFELALICVHLYPARDGQGMLCLAGHLTLDTLCLYTPDTQSLLGTPSHHDGAPSPEELLEHARIVAYRLGLPGLDQYPACVISNTCAPRRVIPFAPIATHEGHSSSESP